VEEPRVPVPSDVCQADYDGMPRNAASTLRRTQGLAPAAKHGLSISNARTETDPLRIVPV